MKFRLIVFTLSLLGYSCVCQAQTNTSNSAGTVNVQQGTASSLKVDLSGTSANPTALKVDGSAVTQPVNCTSGCSSATDKVGVATISAALQSLTLSSLNSANTVAVQIDPGGTPFAGLRFSLFCVVNTGNGTMIQLPVFNFSGTSAGNAPGGTVTVVDGTNSYYSASATGCISVQFFTNALTSGVFNVNMAVSTAIPQQMIVQPGNTPNTTPWLTSDSGTSATASAVPAKAVFIGGNGSGNLTGLTVCDSSAFLQMTTATTTQIVGLLSAKSIRVCGYQIQGSTTSTATTVKFQYGTGSNCVTGTTQITPAWSLAASTASAAGMITMGNGLGELFHAASASELCATSSAAGTVNIFVAYTQY